MNVQEISQNLNQENNRFLRSYGRRKSKTLSPLRLEAMDSVMPYAEIILPKGDELIAPKSFFEKPVNDVRLEIGFGSGEHLIYQAINNSEIGFIGCEPFINGISALCLEIKKHNIKNIKIWSDDARILMLRIEKKSLDKIFLLHPDPWPKTKHHKRRFIQKESLDIIHNLLKENGQLRMATDHVDLAKWLLEKTYFHAGFKWEAESADDWCNPPDDWLETRYCEKGKTAGRPPVYLNFRNI